MDVCFISLANDDSKAKTERIAYVKSLMRENAGHDIYLLPEMWNTGFFSTDMYEENAEDADGETVTAMSDAAAELGAYVLGGSIIERTGGGLYNTAVLFDKRGNICGKYSKIHLFGGEKAKITPGGKICVCDTDFGRVGLSVCYDLRFPEQYRAMTAAGAEIFLTCAAWPESRAEHWELLNRARAVENQALCLSVCAAGFNRGNALAGVSSAVSPRGDVLLKTAAEVESATVDVGEVKKYRSEFSALSDIVTLDNLPVSDV